MAMIAPFSVNKLTILPSLRLSPPSRCSISRSARRPPSEDRRPAATGKARQHLTGFLLRHGQVYAGQRAWTVAYRRWLTTVRFAHPAQQIGDAIVQFSADSGLHPIGPGPLDQRSTSLTIARLRDATSSYTVASRMLRRHKPNIGHELAGIGNRAKSPISATRVIALMNATPRIAWIAVTTGAIDQCPRSCSICSTSRAIRFSASGRDGLPKGIRDIAWKAQVRLCARYRRLVAAGLQSHAR
jgi:transposase